MPEYEPVCDAPIVAEVVPVAVNDASTFFARPWRRVRDAENDAVAVTVCHLVAVPAVRVRLFDCISETVTVRVTVVLFERVPCCDADKVTVIDSVALCDAVGVDMTDRVAPSRLGVSVGPDHDQLRDWLLENIAELLIVAVSGDALSDRVAALGEGVTDRLLRSVEDSVKVPADTDSERT